MWRDDISNYWAMYVCALVCWAFGHMQQAGDENCLFTSDTASDASALAWVQRTACLTPADAMMCRSHGDSAGGDQAHRNRTGGRDGVLPAARGVRDHGSLVKQVQLGAQ